jgi:hypothetical protein
MLVLCYGITKSGSTLAFELVKGILETGGHPQLRLPEDAVNPGHRINYIQPLTRKRLDDLLSAVGERSIAVKTHAALAPPLFSYVEELQGSGRMQVIASYRDPRDICLSLVDAGERARASGRSEFSLMRNIHIAADEVAKQIPKFEVWASLNNTLLLEYELVAFSPDCAIDRIEAVLNVKGDRERAKQYAFEEAFTQKNKGERRRFLSELDEEKQNFLQQRFGEFLRRMYEGDTAEWIAAKRNEILRRGKTKAAKSHTKSGTARPRRKRRRSVVSTAAR